MKRFQPLDRCWLHRSDLQCYWLKQTKSFFKDLHCCAICGVTKLSNRNKKYRFLHNTYLDGVAPMQGCTPYGTTNTYIAKHTTNASGDKMILCNQCHSNRKNPPHAPYVVYQPPAYMKSIVTLNPLHVQLLSFMDIAMHMQSKDWGFSTGKIVSESLLNSPLFGWAENSDASQTIENLVSSLTPLLSQNLHTNPFFQKYMTVFEQLEKNTSMCILTPDVIQPIIANTDTHSMSFPTMDVPRDVYNLALLFDMRTQTQPRKHADFFTIGNVHLRNGSQFDIRGEPITFRRNILNIKLEGMTLESVLFHFLFPHEHGAYDGRTTLSEYLKYRMITLFSPFTLYKPYLLYMYDIRQSVQFLKEVSQQCLEKDIKQTQHAHPHMNEAEVLQHVTKYSLPSSIEGTPRWHKSQLKDLLAMVDKFGMSNMFLILTADEVNFLRWEDVADIE